jgi:uncharacterized protein (TIGR02271 family)
MTFTTEELASARGNQVLDADGDKIGKLEEIYLDQQTGEPEWLSVTTGLFGSNQSFVPVQGATRDGDDLRVPYDKARVKDAPNVEPDGELSPQQEDRLYEHYGRSAEGRFTGDADTGTTGHDTSGPTTDEAMTRSEEELRVGTTREESGRARLRKYVVTEQVQTTVPVQREEVRIEREPITDGNVGEALDGPAISEEEHEVVLHEERPVVGKETVPKERVRMEKDTITDEQTVTDEVRKEQIDVDGDAR